MSIFGAFWQTYQMLIPPPEREQGRTCPEYPRVKVVGHNIWYAGSEIGQAFIIRMTILGKRTNDRARRPRARRLPSGREMGSV